LSADKILGNNKKLVYNYLFCGIIRQRGGLKNKKHIRREENE